MGFLRKYALGFALGGLFVVTWLGQLACQVYWEGAGWARFFGDTTANLASECLQAALLLWLTKHYAYKGAPGTLEPGEECE